MGLLDNKALVKLMDFFKSNSSKNKISKDKNSNGNGNTTILKA